VKQVLGVIAVVGVAAAIAVAASSEAMGVTQPLPLAARVIRSGEFPSLIPQRPTRFSSAHTWANEFGLTPAETRTYETTLRRDGFTAALEEHLRAEVASPYIAGLSWVVQFHSTAAAKTELEITKRLFTTILNRITNTHEWFPVKTIPGATGYHSTRPGVVGEGILFSDGPFLYLVSVASTESSLFPDGPNAPLPLFTRLFYMRVRGHPAA
jgi:hypothetical protein